MAGETKKVTKSGKKATPAAAAAPAKKSKKVVPKVVKNLVSHKSTRPLWLKIQEKAKKLKVDPVTLIKKKVKPVEKKIGGENNGGSRLVQVKKGRKFYPTEDVPKRRRVGRVCYKHHKRTFKAGLEPGRVVIILAGRHKGKRAVVLKTLPSGLLLITGPHFINSIPVRRMHQMYTIVTSKKLDLSSVQVPASIDDRYFRRAKREEERKKSKKSKKGDGADIFDTKTEVYKPDEQRKKDQLLVDDQIMSVIKKDQDKKFLLSYLGSYFQIRKGVYPHKMKF